MKLQRAIALSSTKEEADVMELYKKMGGLVEGETPVVEAPVEVVVETTEVVEEEVKPTKKTKKNAK